MWYDGLAHVKTKPDPSLQFSNEVKNMRNLRIGVIGIGRRAGTHLQAISAMKDMYNLVAVCDKVSERAEEAAEKFHANPYSDLEEMLKKENLDVADIVVPGGAHHSVVVTVAEYGVNMIVETPIAVTLPLADLMINAAKKAGVKLEVAENVWRFPEERMKAEIIKSGLIGDVSRVYCVNTWSSYHAMNSLRNYAGFKEAKSVIGFSKKFPAPPTTGLGGQTETSERWITGIIEFEDGILGIYENSSMLSLYHNAGYRSTRYTEVDGSSGCIVDNDVCIVEGGKPVIYTMHEVTSKINGVDVFERMELNTTPKIVWENPYKKYKTGKGLIAAIDELSSIGNAVLNDTEPSYGALNGRKDQEISIAISESALKGNVPIKLPLTNITSYEENLHLEYREKYGEDPLQWGH